MMMAKRCPEVNQEGLKTEGILQQEEARTTMKQEHAIVHRSILGQFLHDAASRCIFHDGRSKKFHLGKLGHLVLWQQDVDHTRKVSGRQAYIDYLGLVWA